MSEKKPRDIQSYLLRTLVFLAILGVMTAIFIRLQILFPGIIHYLYLIDNFIKLHVLLSPMYTLRSVLEIIFLVTIINLFARPNPALKNTKRSAKKEDTTFDDIAGLGSIKKEMEQIVSFLKNPRKYESMGVSLPRGVLMVGPPGNGKTLIAKAMAGEAGVNFISCSSTEFDDTFVGVGARKVRELFQEARSKAPCIIFIDEIDGMGNRNNKFTASFGPLNELLIAMDGFEKNTNILVIGATNRIDDMDAALKRAGRFDITLHINLPDFISREQILTLYARRLPTDSSLMIKEIAGLTGDACSAELKVIMDMAAQKAAFKDKLTIGGDDVYDALLDMALGKEWDNQNYTTEDAHLIAIHESGHAFMATICSADSNTQILNLSLIPRGNALGHLMNYHPRQVMLESKRNLIASLKISLGGYVAETIIFGRDYVTRGASSDFRSALSTVRKMFDGGMFDENGMGPVSLRDKMGSQHNYLSEMSLYEFEKKAHDFLESIISSMKSLMLQNKTKILALANTLMKRRILSAKDIREIIFAGQEDLIKLADPKVIVELSNEPVSAEEERNATFKKNTLYTIIEGSFEKI